MRLSKSLLLSLLSFSLLISTAISDCSAAHCCKTTLRWMGDNEVGAIEGVLFRYQDFYDVPFDGTSRPINGLDNIDYIYIAPLAPLQENDILCMLNMDPPNSDTTVTVTFNPRGRQGLHLDEPQKFATFSCHITDTPERSVMAEL
jgi:hypothetical protein